jgi:hypothetical protein
VRVASNNKRMHGAVRGQSGWMQELDRMREETVLELPSICHQIPVSHLCLLAKPLSRCPDTSCPAMLEGESGSLSGRNDLGCAAVNSSKKTVKNYALDEKNKA